MTNNIDRAAEVMLATEWKEQGHVIDVDPQRLREYAHALADAGLLTPDPPEPQTFPNGEREWSTLDGWVNLDTDGTITIVYDERDEDDLAAGVEIEPGELVFTKVSEARSLAYALLTAADHAEEADRADA